MKKVLEALFGSWPPPPRVRAICVAILILLLLAILFPQSFVAVVLLVAVIAVGAVVLFFCNRVWKRDEAQAYRAALDERKNHLLYAARAFLYDFMRVDEICYYYSILKPTLIDFIRMDFLRRIGTCDVYRVTFPRPNGAPLFEFEELKDFACMLQRKINEALSYQQLVAPPIAVCNVPVLFVWYCGADARRFYIDIALVCTEQDAHSLRDASRPPEPPQPSQDDYADPDF